MATTPEGLTHKRLALAVIDYLRTCSTDGTLPPEEQENIEVATQCIADSFKVDGSDTSAVADALGPGQNLLSIYKVYEKLRGKSTPSTTPGGSSAAEGKPSTPVTPAASAGDKNPEAERLKGLGNAALQKKDYAGAIDYYSKAIELAPTNAIYLSNRAAAYSATQQHELARQDAEMAVAVDPKYTKAWSRLGLARFALGDAKGSMEAYKKGIDAEGSGGSDAMKKGYETAKRKVEEQGGSASDVSSPERATSPSGAGGAGGAGGMPDLSSLAGMFGGGGGAGGAGAGGGGMPDLASLMNNPMMRQMANNLMQNPEMMNNLMSNPRLREMANQYGGAGGAGAGAGAGDAGGAGAGAGAGGMPDFSSLMNDPSIAELARSFMGGAGGAGGGAGAGAGAGAGRGGSS